MDKAPKILRVLNANCHLLTNEEKRAVALYSLHVEQFENRHVFGDWAAGTQRFPSRMEHVLKD